MLKKPVPPSIAREGPPRPAVAGVVPNGAVNGDVIHIPFEEFRRICNQLRTNELLGPPAADALEAAAGLRADGDGTISPKSKELRTKVASCREEEPEKAIAQETAAEPPPAPQAKAKKERPRMMFSDEPPEEIPEAPPASPTKVAKEEEEESPPKNNEVPELNLNVKQNQLRTDLEMWVMDEIPTLFGVDDSDELDESLQEDEQGAKITLLILEADVDAQKKILEEWLSSAPSAKRANNFIALVLAKVGKIQDHGAKKKKKKQKPV